LLVALNEIAQLGALGSSRTSTAAEMEDVLGSRRFADALAIGALSADHN
jgi:hypothetical protein